MRIFVAVVLVLLARLAHAAPTPDVVPPGMAPAIAPPPPPADEGMKSYWHQTLAADGVAVGLLFGAAAAQSGEVATLSLGTYLLAAPAIHLEHGRPVRALGSLALRAGLPLAGILIGAALEPEPVCDQYECYGDDEAPSGEVALGFAIGVVAASIIDAAVLADGHPPKAKPQSAWTPTARATHGGFALGLTGSF